MQHGGVFVWVSPNTLIPIDEQFNNNTDNKQNYCNKSILPEPCVNEPTTQPEPRIQEKLGKNILKNWWQWNIKPSIQSDINTTTATSKTCQ